jgi:anaerobic magnesium-protoporphyrin IX monomethyl ester cyclase
MLVLLYGRPFQHSLPPATRDPRHAGNHTGAQGREIGLIDFEDENMAMDRAWFERLLREIVRHFGERKLELRAMNGLYPPALDKKTIHLMHAAGFRELNLALITCDRDQSARFNRASVVKAFDRVLQWAEPLKMTAVGYLIAGAPGQAPLTTVDDLLFLAGRRVLVGLSTYYPAPDSLDFNRLPGIGPPPGFSSLLAIHGIAA